MVKWLLIILVLLCTAGAANAELVVFGPICWNTNAADTFRGRGYFDDEDSVTSFTVDAFRIFGPTAYQLSGAGSAHESDAMGNPGTGTFTMDVILGQGATPWWNSHPICRLRARLNPVTLNGPFEIRCGGGALMPFTVTGMMTETNCESLTTSLSNNLLGSPK